MRNPDCRHATIALLVAASTLGAACDDLTRFKQERYECNSNRHGLAEIDFRSMEVGDEIGVGFADGTRNMLITESTDRNFTLTADELILRIDRNTGTVRLTRGSRYLNISCAKSEFRM